MTEKTLSVILSCLVQMETFFLSVKFHLLGAAVNVDVSALAYLCYL